LLVFLQQKQRTGPTFPLIVANLVLLKIKSNRKIIHKRWQLKKLATLSA